tara:strand:+ start:3004 stop:3354 length:351 start_codon:yes stop_codon:yes gene_type:complete
MTISVREIFYKVERHLLKQNVKSENEYGSCQYRSYRGLSCAVGCLMTDDMYSHTLEGKCVVSNEVEEAIAPIIGVHEGKRRIKLELLHRLQKIHDDSCVANWDIKLRQLKLDFNIS